MTWQSVMCGNVQTVSTTVLPTCCPISAGQFVAACKGSLRRLGMEQLGIGQLHWSTANYQPLQERALWDGLVALYDEVSPHETAIQ